MTKEINTDKVQKSLLPPAIFCDFRVRILNGICQKIISMPHNTGFQWNLISMVISATGNDNSTTISLVPTTRKFWVLEWKLGPLQNPTECTDELVKYKHGRGILCWENRRRNEDIPLALSGTIHLVWLHSKPLQFSCVSVWRVSLIKAWSESSVFVPRHLSLLMLRFVFFSLREFDGPSLKIEGTGKKFCQCLSIVTNLIRLFIPFVWFLG